MAAQSSMSNKRAPGAVPRSLERHHHVPRSLETRLSKAAFYSSDFKETLTSTMRSSSAPALATSAQGDEDFAQGTGGFPNDWSTSNSTYGQAYSPTYRLDRDTITATRERNGVGVDCLPSEITEGLQVARPLTIRNPQGGLVGEEQVELVPDGAWWEEDEENTNPMCHSPLSPDETADAATLEEGQTTKPTGRYAREKKLNWELNVEAARNGLAIPSKVNGYGQALSAAAKNTGFKHTAKEPVPHVNLAFTGVPLEVTNPESALKKPQKSVKSRLARWRSNPVIEAFNTGETVEHATYKPPVHKPTRIYTGPKTGYTSGFARNMATMNLADPPEVNVVTTLDDIHPSVVKTFKVKDPIAYNSLLHPDDWGTTYKQTIGASAETTMNIIS